MASPTETNELPDSSITPQPGWADFADVAWAFADAKPNPWADWPKVVTFMRGSLSVLYRLSPWREAARWRGDRC